MPSNDLIQYATSMNAVDTVTTRHEPLRTTQASPAASIPATATSNYTVRYISAPPVRLLQPTRSSPLSLSRCIDNRRWPASPTRGLRRTRRLRISSCRRSRIIQPCIPPCDVHPSLRYPAVFGDFDSLEPRLVDPFTHPRRVDSFAHTYVDLPTCFVLLRLCCPPFLSSFFLLSELRSPSSRSVLTIQHLHLPFECCWPHCPAVVVVLATWLSRSPQWHALAVWP